MIKYLKLPLRLELVRHPDQTGLTVRLEPAALKDWCLGLVLLNEGLIDALAVQEVKGKGKLRIQRLPEAKDQARSQADFGSGSTLLKLTPSALGYLLHFFLRYHRDGLAEVDHVDLEVEGPKENRDACITFEVPNAISQASDSRMD